MDGAEPKPVPSKWLKISVHFWIHIVVLGGLSAAYYGAHYWLRPSYERASEPALRAALSEYRIARSADGTRLELRGPGGAYAAGGDENGVTKDAALQAFLGGVGGELEAFNVGVERLVGRVSGAFAPNSRAQLTGLYAALGVSPTSGASIERMSMKGGDLVAGPSLLQGLRGLEQVRAEFGRLSIESNGDIEALTKPAVVSGDIPFSTRESAVYELRSGNVLRNDLRDDLLSALDQSVEALARGLSVEPRGTQEHPAPGLEGDVASGTELSTASIAAGPAGLEAWMGQWNGRLNDELARLVRAQIGWFWIFGHWRWFEVILLAMLGVLVEGAIRLGLHLTRRTTDPTEVWNPEETRRTALKLLYAPVLSVITIWTLMATNIVEVDVASATSPTGMVTFAFLLGLFPNLAYSIFERIATAVFGRTTVASKPHKAQMRLASVQSTTPVDRGAPPSFDNLKGVLRKHVLAPFE